MSEEDGRWRSRSPLTTYPFFSFFLLSFSFLSFSFLFFSFSFLSFLVRGQLHAHGGDVRVPDDAVVAATDGAT
jgi:hypothetical protein